MTVLAVCVALKPDPSVIDKPWLLIVVFPKVILAALAESVAALVVPAVEVPPKVIPAGAESVPSNEYAVEALVVKLIPLFSVTL